MEDFGSGCSRTLSAVDRAFNTVVWLNGKPPLNSEWNLMQQADSEARTTYVRSVMPSGWLGDGISPERDYVTNSRFSNLFYLGQQAGYSLNADGSWNGTSVLDQASPLWANVNGWIVPVTGSRTGSLPLAPNNLDARNRVELSSPPTAVASVRVDFVLLEVWKAQVAPSPSATNKPSASEIWRFGNVLGGWTPFVDDLQDPVLGKKTTERVQIQYRIRVVENIDLTSYPDGFDVAKVFGQGAAGVNSTYTFSNMQHELGDPGLWRSGNGVASNTLGTVDGYAYAIPICAVFRRNQTAFSDANIQGGYNRNLLGTSKIYSTVEMASFTASLDRPDRLGSDQIIADDILDLRHTVSPSGFDYQTLLQSNLAKLLKGGMRTTWKRAHSGDCGTRVMCVDAITNAGTSLPAGVERIDGFDGKRRVFSDAGVTDWTGALAWIAPSSNGTGTGWPRTNVQAEDFGFDYGRSVRVDVLAQSKDMEFRASLMSPNDYAPTAGDAALPDLTSEAFWTFYADILLLHPDSINAKFVYSQRAARYLNPGDRFDFMNAGGVVIQKSGSLVTYAVNGQHYWCTGPLIDDADISSVTKIKGSHTGKLRSDLTPYWGTSTNVGTEPRFTFPVDHGPITNSYIGMMVTIGNSADPSDNGSYEITGISSNGAPAVVLLNKTTPWATPSATLVWDLAYSQTTVDRGLLIRLAPAFPNVSRAVTDREEVLRISAPVVYSPGHGLSRKGLACHEVELINPPDVVYLSDGDSKLPVRWMRLNPYTEDASRGSFGGQFNFRVSPAYADIGSKTVMVQPWTVATWPDVHLTDGGAGVLMPRPDGDPLGLFAGKTGLHWYADLDGRLGTRSFALNTVGADDYLGFDLPVQPESASGALNWDSGLNFFLPLLSGIPSPQEQWVFAEDNSGAHWMVFATHEQGGVAPVTFGAQVFGYSYGAMGIRHVTFTVDNGNSTVRGLELPYYMGPGRLFAIYERSDYEANGTHFTLSDRKPRPGVGATNLLISTETLDTLWLKVDSSKDGTFIIPEKLIQGYDPASHYIIEANVFGFDREFFAGNCRVIPVTGRFSSQVYGDRVPAPSVMVPMPYVDGGQARIRYSRRPYQGDINGTQHLWQDTPYLYGAIPSSGIFNTLSTPVDPESPTLLENPTHFEVLAVTGFVTDCGTGSISGTFFLDSTDGGVGSTNVSYPFMCGYEQRPSVWDITPTTPAPRAHANGWVVFPDPSPNAVENPVINFNIVSLLNPSTVGETDGLPLGSYFRDHHLIGLPLHSSQAAVVRRSQAVLDHLTGSVNIPTQVAFGGGSLGTLVGELCHNETDMPEYIGADVLTQKASASTGPVGIGTLITLVDADSTSPAPASGSKFRTTRGKGILVSSGDTAGGPVCFTTAPTEYPNPIKAVVDDVTGAVIGLTSSAVSPLLSCVAMLVRNTEEVVGSKVMSSGGELQMVIVSSVPYNFAEDWTANYTQDVLTKMTSGNRSSSIPLSVHSGVAGVSEGFSAAERYRLGGHPLVRGARFVPPDLTSFTLMRPGPLAGLNWQER